MIALKAIVLIMALLGGFIFFYSIRAIYFHFQGSPILNRESGEPIHFAVWPASAFFGAMVIAGSLPGLLGHPMWLLEKVFSVISRL